jgi:hypothetical protein
VKANIRHYFMNVLANPAHPRYRTYYWLQRGSRIRTNDIGQRHIVRTLHTNSGPRRASDRPTVRWGLNQVVADYYNVEVVEFSDPADRWPTEFQIGILGAQITHVSRGNRNARQVCLYRNGRSNPESSRKDAVLVPASVRQADFRWDTSADANVDRLEFMPWYPAANIPDNMMPTPLNADLRFENPAVRAPQGDVAYVAGGKDMAFVNPPVLPARSVMQAWLGQ